MPVITDLFYLPPIEYFAAIADHQEIWVDVDGSYQKQTFRNRTRIRLTNKVETLSIPVKNRDTRASFREVEIDYTQKWKNIHLRGFQSAYGKAPFFEYYFPYLESIYAMNLPNLVTLNLELLTVCLKLLKLNILVKTVSDNPESGNAFDIRGLISPKQDFNARNIYKSHPYPQLFGVDFVPNLSIVDLLFCVGPDSKEILKQSQKK